MKNRFRIFLLGLLSLTAGTLFADTFDASFVEALTE